MRGVCVWGGGRCVGCAAWSGGRRGTLGRLSCVSER